MSDRLREALRAAHEWAKEDEWVFGIHGDAACACRRDAPDYDVRRSPDYDRTEHHDTDCKWLALMVQIEAALRESEGAPQVTRFEVIDHRHGAPSVGRVFVAWGCSVELSYQDDGRTLKVFVEGQAGEGAPEGPWAIGRPLGDRWIVSDGFAVVDMMRGGSLTESEASAVRDALNRLASQGTEPRGPKT